MRNRPIDDDFEAGPAGTERTWRADVELLRAGRPRHILFLCVGNSARSQLAEGIARALAPTGVRISSAGVLPSAVRSEVAQVLAEIDIDISHQRAKSVGAIEAAGTVDAAISLCTEGVSPASLRRVLQVHWPLPDPATIGGEKERLAGFRAVRDALRVRLEALFKDWPGAA